MLPGEVEFNAEQAANAPVRVEINGQSGTVSKADLPAALAAGGKELAPAGTQDSDLMGSLKAAEVEFGSHVAGGLIPKVIQSTAKGLGAHDWARGWKENYEAAVQTAETEHPYAAAAGAGLGMAADMLGPIGKVSGAAGAGVRAGLGGGALARVAATGVEAALQQSAYNVGHQISEDELGDVDSNAEKLFAAATNKDVLLAGATGAALQGAGELFKGARGLLAARKGPASAEALDAATGVSGAGKLVAKDLKVSDEQVELLRKSGFTEEKAREAISAMQTAADDAVAGTRQGLAKDAIDKISDMAADAAAGGDPAKRDILKAAYSQKYHTGVQREVHLAETAQKLKGLSNEILEDQHVVRDTFWGVRREVGEKLVDPANYSAARDQAASLLQAAVDLGKKLDEYKYPVPKEVQIKGEAFRKAVEAAGGDITNPAAIRKAMSELHYAANDLKTTVGREMANPGQAFNMPVRAELAREFHDKVLKNALEDSSIWGQLGDLQAGINKTVSQDARKGFQFMKALGAPALEADPANAWVGLRETDPGKWETLLKNVGTNASEIDTRAIHGWLDQAEGLAKHVSTIEGLTPAQVAKIQRISANATAMRQELAKATLEANVINKLNAHQKLEAEAGHGLLGHGLVGGLAGAALSPMRTPLKFQHTLSSIAQAAAYVDRALGSAAKGLTGSAPKVAKFGISSTRDELTKEIAGVKEAAANPELLMSRGAKMLGTDLPDAAPKHAASISATMGRAVTFLATMAPQGRPTSSILPSGKDAVRYSDIDLERYERARDAVRNPMKVVEDAQHGTLSREGVQALRQVYPKIYQQLQMHVLDELTMMSAKGQLDDMPYQQRILIGTLLQIPADESLQPETIAAIQKVKMQSAQAPAPNQPAQQQGGGRRPFKLDPSMFRTDSQTIEAGGRAA
jgi:hypothetical protein